jgi:hypothetical protein
MGVGLLSQAELAEDAVDVLLDRADRQHEGGCDGRVALACGHLREYVAFPLGECLQGRGLGVEARSDQDLDHLRVDDRPSSGDLDQRPHELGRIGGALLEEIASSLAAVLQQGHHEVGVIVLAEHHHAHLRTSPSQQFGDPDSLVAHARWHPDVGEDDVRNVFVHRGQQLVVVTARPEELDLWRCCEHRTQAFPDDLVVLGQDDSNRHDTTVEARNGRWT